MPILRSPALFCALRPPPELARELCEQFDWLGPRDDRVEPERLHVTLVPVPVWPSGGSDTIDRACAVCAAVRAASFRIVFDELVVGDRILLKPSEAVPALNGFQFGLRNALADAGLMKRTGRAFRPHLTVSYRARTQRRIFIPPVSWEVREFVLIESLFGQRTQIERGRWVFTDCPPRSREIALLLQNGSSGVITTV